MERILGSRVVLAFWETSGTDIVKTGLCHVGDLGLRNQQASRQAGLSALSPILAGLFHVAGNRRLSLTDHRFRSIEDHRSVALLFATTTLQTTTQTATASVAGVGFLARKLIRRR